MHQSKRKPKPPKRKMSEEEEVSGEYNWIGVVGGVLVVVLVVGGVYYATKPSRSLNE